MAAFAGFASFAGPGAPPAAADDEVDRAIAAFRERMESAPDPAARAMAVAEVGLKRDPRVAEALKPFLAHADPPVRIAAARTIGEQRDPGVAATLQTLYEKQDDAGEPDKAFMVALLEGIGEADPGRRYKVLEKAARKWLDLDPELARAAARGMALARTRDAVEDLIVLMERADGMIGFQTEDHWKKAFEFTADFMTRELRGLTGVDLKGVKAWKDWWKANKRTWRAPLPGEERNVGGAQEGTDDWVDPAGKFSVRRPSGAWKWRQGESSTVWAQREVEGRLAAEFSVRRAPVSGLASQTARAMAEEWKSHIEEDMKEIRKEGTRWDVKLRFAGESAVMHEVLGRHVERDVATFRYVFLVHGGNMYRIVGYGRGGRTEPVWKEVEEFFASFRFARR